MIEKIRDTMKYIRSSPTRKENFEEIVAQLGISCEKGLALMFTLDGTLRI
jgi:hypothetical protein